MNMKILLTVGGVIILILTILLFVIEPASAPSNNELPEMNSPTAPGNQPATSTPTASSSVAGEPVAPTPIGEIKKDPAPEVNPVAKACVVGGCSSQLCVEESGEPLMTTCEFKEVYACYRTATCTRQTTGQCGWTDTPELRACVASSVNEPVF